MEHERSIDGWRIHRRRMMGHSHRTGRNFGCKRLLILKRLSIAFEGVWELYDRLIWDGVFFRFLLHDVPQCAE